MSVTSVTVAKKQLQDIYVDVSWRQIAHDYFGKSSGWIYHKLDGIDGNGKPTSFTDEEKEILRNALIDLSNRIRTTAENFL